MKKNKQHKKTIHPRKPNPELKKFLLGFDGKLEIVDLLPIVNTTFNENYDYKGLVAFCHNNKIKYKSQRDRYIEYKNYLESFKGKLSINELLPLLNKKYNIKYSKKKLKEFLHNHKIPYKNVYNTVPVGSVVGKSKNGIIFVKKANNIYTHKQRYLYEQYHNEKLTTSDYIIFLNGDKNDFRIENLKKVTSREHRNMAGVGLYFKDKDLTETGLQIAKLKIKTKEKDN